MKRVAIVTGATSGIGRATALALSDAGWWVLAHGRDDLRGQEVEDQLQKACPADYGYDARIEIYGTEGVIFVGSPVKPGAMVVRADGASADPVTSWRALFADAYRAEDAHLIEVARGEAAPLTTAIDGLRALEVVFAVNESLRTGRTVHLEEVQSS